MTPATWPPGRRSWWRRWSPAGRCRPGFAPAPVGRGPRAALLRKRAGDVARHWPLLAAGARRRLAGDVRRVGGGRPTERLAARRLGPGPGAARPGRAAAAGRGGAGRPGGRQPLRRRAAAAAAPAAGRRPGRRRRRGPARRPGTPAAPRPALSRRRRARVRQDRRHGSRTDRPGVRADRRLPRPRLRHRRVTRRRRRAGGHLRPRRRSGWPRRSRRSAARSGRSGWPPTWPTRTPPQRLVAAAREHFGRLDGALVSVGGPPPGTAAAVTDEQWRESFETVFLGSVRAARTVAAALTDGGAIGAGAVHLGARARCPGWASPTGCGPAWPGWPRTWPTSTARAAYGWSACCPGGS